MSNIDKPKLKDLVNELTCVASKWYEIGLQLDFEEESGVLDNIKASHAHNGVETQLLEMLKTWLKRVDPAPSWSTIINALRAPPFGKRGLDLANKLETKYCHGQSPTGNSLQLEGLSSSTTSSSSNPNASLTSTLSSPTSPVFSQGSESGPLVVRESEAKLKADFTTLLWNMCEKLVEINVNMKDFCRHVAWLFPPGDFIPTTSDPKEIFSVLTENELIDYLNYNPLKSIANKFDKTTAEGSLLDLVKGYQVKRTAFVATTSLAQYISMCEDEEEADPDEPLDRTRYDKAYFKKLRFKLKIMITNETLEYIDVLWRSLAEEFLLPSLPVLLDKVIYGSLTIVWLVQDHMIQKILERIPEASDFFQRHHIVEVFIEDECVYKDDTEQVDMEDPEYSLPRRIDDERVTGPLSEYLMVDPDIEILEGHETDEQPQSVRPTMWKRFTTFVQGGIKGGATRIKVGVLNVKLIWAARRGNENSVQELLNNGAEPNCKEKDPYRWTPLMWASHNGHSSVVSVLLQNGADPNIGATANWTALILASRNGHHEVVKLLLDNGAVVNVKNNFGWSSLMWASQCRDYYGAKISTNPEKKENLKKVCEHLLSNGADPNVESKNGWTPVMQASQDGHAEFVRLLAESHANLNHLDKKEETFALMVAATKGHDDVVETLAACGADLNLRNKKQQTALHVACYKGHTEIVHKFIRYNADLNIKDRMGLTPIMIASKCGKTKVMKLLCESEHVDLNIQAEKYANWTPLMFAAKNGNPDSIRLLLKHGAKVGFTDSNGQSVFGIARVFNHSQKINKTIQEFFDERTKNPPAEIKSMPEVIQLQLDVGFESGSAQMEPVEESAIVHQTTDLQQEVSVPESDADEILQQPTPDAAEIVQQPTPDAAEIVQQPTPDAAEIVQQSTSDAAKLSTLEVCPKEDDRVTSANRDTDERTREQKFIIEEIRRLSGTTVIRANSYKSFENNFNAMMLPTIAAAA